MPFCTKSIHTLRAEECRRRGGNQERRRACHQKNAPAAGSREHDREQQAKLGLERQQAEQDAGQHRLSIEAGEDRQQHRRGHQRALPGDHAENGCRRKRDRGEQSSVAGVPAHNPKKKSEAQRGPAEERREIGQAAEQRGDEHDARRIRPVLTGIAGAQQGRERVPLEAEVRGTDPFACANKINGFRRR
jgi:hypothetical protein